MSGCFGQAGHWPSHLRYSIVVAIEDLVAFGFQAIGPLHSLLLFSPCCPAFKLKLDVETRACWEKICMPAYWQPATLGVEVVGHQGCVCGMICSFDTGLTRLVLPRFTVRRSPCAAGYRGCLSSRQLQQDTA